MPGVAPKANAATITVAETLQLLDGPFSEFAEGVARAEYALWLGSGISRERVDDLHVIARRVLIHISDASQAEGGRGPYTEAVGRAVNMALTAGERAAVQISSPAATWPHLPLIVERLVGRYADLLDIRVNARSDDYLLWDVVDVRSTYAGDNLEPDCEHLAVAILALEGIFPAIASANWDGLVEKAIAQLTGGNPDIVAVCVRADDMRAAARRSQLYKYHGCAVLAKKDEARYREYIIGRSSQITDWPHDPRFAVMKNKLVGLTSTARTLMVGLSAQDSNIQDIFSAGRAMMTWPYPSHPPAYVFAEDSLGADQEKLLKCVYRDAFTPNQKAIEAGAKIPAYGKSLLSALVLNVLGQKIVALIGLATAPSLTDTERGKLLSGVIGLRNQLAAGVGSSGADKLAFMRSLIAALTQTLAMFRGDSAALVRDLYGPVGVFPVGQQGADPQLQASAMPELAVLLGLLGIGREEEGWTLARPADGPAAGTVVITSSAIRARQKLFAVADSEVLSRLVLDGVVNEDDPNTIVAVCAAPAGRFQRSPSAAFGRVADNPRCREVSIRSLVNVARSAEQLMARFKEEAVL